MFNQFFQDRKFFSTFLKIAIPITVQQFVSSFTNMLDVLMVGQLGEVSIAALGLSNQLFFLMIVIFFGVNSGIAIFTAQYWGKRDLVNLRRVMGIGLTLSLILASFFTFIAVLFPAWVLGIFTEDQAVISVGSQYLQIVALSYIFTALTTAYVAVLRSSENVRLPMAVSVFAISLNILLNYTLIFGNFGMPALGVKGAAIGTTIARTLECLLIVFFSYRFRTAAAARLHELRYSLSFLKNVLKTSLPALINEVLWSVGITTYNVVYGHIGTSAIAAININATIENMSFVIFIAMANACAIMIGNQIGAGNERVAFAYSKRFLVMGIGGALLMGLLVILLRPFILSLYNLQADSYRFAYTIQLIYGLTMWIRVSNVIFFIGVLRSGGDTRFALLVEMCSIWLVGVPSAFIGGFVLGWPVYGVYALVLLEEIVKLIAVIPRYLSKKWIHNLAASVT